MKNKISIKLLIHLVFWVFYIIVLFIFCPPFFWDLDINWYDRIDFELLFLVVSVTYINDQFLLPYFFRKKLYLSYSVLILTLLFLITILYCKYGVCCDDNILSCLSNNLWITIQPTVFLSFIWIVLQFFEKQKELEKAHKDRLELELKFLKSQINPHVLFNSLNTIYAQAVKENDAIAELILMLSDNLKYVLNKSNDTLVALEKDITFIENYLEFQTLRTQGINKINYTKEIDSYNHAIAPLILIDLIENSFKYSIYKNDELSVININLKIKNGKLHFVCSNEFDSSIYPNTIETSQIGLKNLRKRLQLIYENNFVLDINKDNGLFTVDLKINLT